MGQVAFQPTISYAPRSPQGTVLFKTVNNHLNSFFAIAESGDKFLAKHVKEEFESFLHCGILAYGFLRLKCDGCKSERLVAFSCKKRGFCASCGGRRMNESAGHLVDEVFPHVGVRQWVLSFPFPIRFLLARSPQLQSKVLGITLRAIHSLLQKKAKKKIKGGSVTIMQRFGGSLNLNLHFHMLLLEGGYEEEEFFQIDRPRDEEIQELVKVIGQRVIRYLKKQGHFADEQESVEVEEGELLTELQAASVRNRVALGERRGQWIRRIGSIGEREVPELTGPLCASVGGFSLHAAVYCGPNDRKKLEQLCRYIARPAVAEERLRLAANDDVVMKLKKPYSDGTSHLVFSPVEFIEKLAALVPPPRAHLTRFHGVLAPNAKARSKIVPKEKAAGDIAPARKRKKITWAKLLKRVFGIDMERCECGGEMKVIAAIMERGAVVKILKHVNQPHEPPERGKSRIPVQLEMY